LHQNEHSAAEGEFECHCGVVMTLETSRRNTSQHLPEQQQGRQGQRRMRSDPVEVTDPPGKLLMDRARYWNRRALYFRGAPKSHHRNDATSA
jgi:hypothetical protein